MTPPSTTIVVVNWNGRHLLSDCVTPLIEDGLPVVVVDNSSTDESVVLLADEFPTVDVVVNATNVGFAAANNIGIAQASTELVLLLNNDTVPNARAVTELDEFMRANPAVGIAGPTLVYPDGSPQESCGPGPNLWTESLGKTMLHRLLPGRRSWAPTGSRQVDWVTGAALCIRRDLALELGGLDEDFFMFYEDLDLCTRVRKAGWEVWFVATRPIVHIGGASRRRVEAETLVHSYHSTFRYFDRHGPRWRSLVIRVITVPELALRSLLWGAMAALPSRRSLARERLRAYRRVLRSLTAPSTA